MAERMRATLVEVLGQERGEAMYTLAWLEERVRFHLDRPTAAVYVAELGGAIVGHTIVRVEHEPPAAPFGLFSTTYVVPEARNQDVAKQLLAQGETWMRAQGLAEAVTYTDVDNLKLQRLYQGLGYTLTPAEHDFVRLARRL